MIEDLFVSECTDTGPLLHSSLWRRNIQSQGQPALIYQKCIQYDNSFDLRFAFTEDTLTFTLLDKEITFQVVAGDQNTCHALLKAHLNQTGFHEQYKPIKKIGKGNFASVYLVENINDGLKYAAKAFSKEAIYSEETGKDSLMKEISIMRHLSGKHNLKLCEVFESENSLYIVFELLEGGQLFNKIKAKEKFKPQQIRRIVRGILQGLKEMHSKNIMHRDLKPENILLRTENGDDCVIADYGLSEFCDNADYLFVRCGTPGYVAPQIINIRDMSTRYSTSCDIFSLGLVFHLLLFGKSLFKGKTYTEVLTENRICNVNLFGPQYQHIDGVIMDLLRKMLKMNPEERITAEQALNHPYFQYEQETQLNELDIFESLDRVVQIGASPILTATSENSRQAKSMRKDSCLELKLGKDNPFNRTDTVEHIGSRRISGLGASLLKSLGVSKFVKQKRQAN